MNGRYLSPSYEATDWPGLVGVCAFFNMHPSPKRTWKGHSKYLLLWSIFQWQSHDQTLHRNGEVSLIKKIGQSAVVWATSLILIIFLWYWGLKPGSCAGKHPDTLNPKLIDEFQMQILCSPSMSTEAVQHILDVWARACMLWPWWQGQQSAGIQKLPLHCEHRLYLYARISFVKAPFRFLR